VRSCLVQYQGESGLTRLSVPGELPRVRGDVPSVRRVVQALLLASDEPRPSGLVSLRETYGPPDDRLDPFVGAEPKGERFVMLCAPAPVGQSDPRRLRALLDTCDATPLLSNPWFDPTDELGLSECLAIVHRQGGGFRVVRASGTGLWFEVYFPVADEAADDTSTAGEPDFAQGLTFKGHGRVLVIDDEPSVARLTGLVLDQHGFQVEVAGSGNEALALIEQTPRGFRLIIVDLSMPDLSGVEVLQHARAMGCAAPMVLTSGYSRNEAAQEAGNADFAGYLQKPYRLETLLDVIQAALVER
jgi:CheY-like chemotaxis protein